MEPTVTFLFSNHTDLPLFLKQLNYIIEDPNNIRVDEEKQEVKIYTRSPTELLMLSDLIYPS